MPGRELSPSGDYFDSAATVSATGRRIPHWQQREVPIFVTWRLADSVARTKLQQWSEDRESWIAHHPPPWDEAAEEQFHEMFSQRMDDWLDQGAGSCLLRDPGLAQVLASTLLWFDGDRYDLTAFVVMPNHVHVLFRPIAPARLPDIVRSWKGVSAREINKVSGRLGTLWAREATWARLIRNERHEMRCRDYIQQNPVKAGLGPGEFVLYERA